MSRFLRSPNVIVLLFALSTFSTSTTGHAQTGPAPDDPVVADPPLTWFKGNLHTHSLWSDGDDFPEMIADWYTRHGYHFLALSDHNVLSQGQRWMSVAQANERAKAGRPGPLPRPVRRQSGSRPAPSDGDLQVRLKPLGEFRALLEQPGRFLLIQAEEITDHFEKKPIHMNATNVLELIKPQGGKSVVEAMENNLEAVEEQAGRLGRPILAPPEPPELRLGRSPPRSWRWSRGALLRGLQRAPGRPPAGRRDARRRRADVGHRQHPAAGRDEGRRRSTGWPPTTPTTTSAARLVARAGAGSWSAPGT